MICTAYTQVKANTQEGTDKYGVTNRLGDIHISGTIFCLHELEWGCALCNCIPTLLQPVGLIRNMLNCYAYRGCEQCSYMVECSVVGEVKAWPAYSYIRRYISFND